MTIMLYFLLYYDLQFLNPLEPKVNFHLDPLQSVAEMWSQQGENLIYLVLIKKLDLIVQIWLSIFYSKFVQQLHFKILLDLFITTANDSADLVKGLHYWKVKTIRLSSFFTKMGILIFSFLGTATWELFKIYCLWQCPRCTMRMRWVLKFTMS